MNDAKKILILSCCGGGGHMSVATAIEQYLRAHEVVIVDLIGKSLAPLDPIYRATGRHTGQDLYNFLLQKNCKILANLFFRIGCVIVKCRKKSLGHAITEQIKSYKADLVISVIPMINDLIVESCAQLDIPCLIVPTDFDVTTFVHNIPPKPAGHVTICMSMQFPEVIDRLNAPLRDRHSVITGFPIRSSFFVPKDSSSIKKAHDIPQDKPVVLMIMGATGSVAAITYLHQLCKIAVPYHLVICIGRGLFLKPSIERTRLPTHVSTTIVDCTTDIADMMAIADLCITKPGSVTFAEVMYMNIPMLLDQTTPSLLWERLNVALLKRYNLGDVITHHKKIVPLVTSYLVDGGLRDEKKGALQRLPKEQFSEHINTIVRNMLAR